MKNERLLLRDACSECPLSLLTRLLSKWLKPCSSPLLALPSPRRLREYESHRCNDAAYGGPSDKSGATKHLETHPDRPFAALRVTVENPPQVEGCKEVPDVSPHLGMSDITLLLFRVAPAVCVADVAAFQPSPPAPRPLTARSRQRSPQ